MKLDNNKTTSDEQFYRSYEIQLLNQIGYINHELRDSQNMQEWHLNQRNILQKRLNYVQNKIEREYEIEQTSTQTDEEKQILQDHFDHPSDNSFFNSLRSWAQEYLKIDYNSACKFATEHCKNIKKKYVDKYNKCPMKVCKEFVYKNEDVIKEVLVNSFSKLEFMDIVKPYMDQYYETEGHL